jgi:hypothetical protein
MDLLVKPAPTQCMFDPSNNATAKYVKGKPLLYLASFSLGSCRLSKFD